MLLFLMNGVKVIQMIDTAGVYYQIREHIQEARNYDIMSHFLSHENGVNWAGFLLKLTRLSLHQYQKESEICMAAMITHAPITGLMGMSPCDPRST